VVEILKGKPLREKIVHGYVPSLDCWAPFNAGAEYVVLLPDAAGKSGAWISMYSKTVPYQDVPEKLLRVWRGKR
jgi:hypothetical protein